MISKCCNRGALLLLTAAILGDTHFDAEPESVYHSHYDESNPWAKVQHAEFRHDLDFFRPGLKEYFFNKGAGHFRSNASDAGVDIELYPGAATSAARTFKLK